MNASSLMGRGLLALGLTVALVGPALAIPINPINTRQEPVGPPAGGEVALQTILNGMGMGVNAATDQSTVGMWQSAILPASTIPTMVAEYAGLAGVNTFGMFFGSDSSNLYQVNLFNGSADAGTAAGVTINGNTVSVFSNNCAKVNCGDFTNALVTSSGFGFYLTNANGTFYSADSLNSGGTPMMLAYENSTNWALAMEDTLRGDRDFNDMVVKVESLKAVPEPASLLLLGNGILAMGAWAIMTRRKNQA